MVAIIASHRTRGHGPSHHELRSLMGLRGLSSVERSLLRLERRGLIERIRRGLRTQSGGIVPTIQGLRSVGQQFEAEERIEHLDMSA
jgi:hypothetical protein